MNYPLRELRKRRNLTLQEVANYLTEHGVYDKATTAHVSRLEERGTMNYRILQALSSAYSLSMAEVAALSEQTIRRKQNVEKHLTVL